MNLITYSVCYELRRCIFCKYKYTPLTLQLEYNQTVIFSFPELPIDETQTQAAFVILLLLYTKQGKNNNNQSHNLAPPRLGLSPPLSRLSSVSKFVVVTPKFVVPKL